MCGDARRVKWRQTHEKRGCFAIMTKSSTECTAWLSFLRKCVFYSIWCCVVSVNERNERRTCMASAIWNIFSFYFGRRFLTPKSSEKILSSRWESWRTHDAPSSSLRVIPWTEKAAGPKKPLHRKLGPSDCPLKIKYVSLKYIMWACKCGRFFSAL